MPFRSIECGKFKQKIFLMRQIHLKERKREMRKNIARVLLLSLTLSAISPMQDADAATKLTLSNKSISIKVGATKTVKANKTVKWKTSNKKIATVKKLSKKKAKITAKKAGSCKITAIAGKKKATIRVTVKKASKPTKKPTVTVKPTSTAKATSTPVSTPTATIAPTATAVIPTPSCTPVVSATAIAVPTATVSSSIVPETTEVPTTITSAEPTATTVAASIEPTVTIAPTATATTVVASVEPTTAVTATIEPSATPTVIPVTATDAGISMNLVRYENGKLSYTINNQSCDDLCYNYYSCILEKENNGEWISVEPDRYLNAPAIMKNLSQGTEVEEIINVKEQYDLMPGNYRLTRKFYFENNDKMVELKLPFEVTNTIVYEEGISMALDCYENGKITYTIKNESFDDIQYKQYYSIEKQINGEWVEVKPDRNTNVTMNIVDINRGNEECITTDIKGSFDLPAGNYRFVKVLFCKNYKCAITLKLPFKVTNTIVYNSGVVMTLDNYADGVISFTIENKYNDEIKYSRDDYTLQKESNGEWIILEPAREFLVRNECVTLNRKERDTQTVNLALGYDLEPGNYRFVKSFAEQGEIALPFEVTKENTKVTPVIVSQSAVSVVLGGYDNGALTYMITNQTGKKIRYSYEAIGKEFNNGELGLIKLLVPETDGTDGEVEADMTKKNKVQLDLPSGNYYYFITITIEESDGADTQEFTLQVPFEVK